MWIESDNKLIREINFNDFEEAISFINKVAEISERDNHHPEINNNYNRVKLSLCTHDQGSIITDKDYSLAQKIDQLL